MREEIEGQIARFNARVQEDAKLRGELQGIEKTVLLDLKDGTKYHFVLRDTRIDGLRDGPIENPDITIFADAATIRGLISRELGPMKAYATGRLRIKGELEDLLRFRKFF